MSRQRWRALSPLRGLCLAAVVWNIASSSTICIAMPDDTKRPGATWKDTLAAARVAVPVPVDGITVFSGTGKRLRAWEPRALETAAQARRLVAYYSPDVHPARERVLCIRCLERLVKGGNHEREQPEQLECAITELRIDGEGEEQLLALTPGKRISSPVYSPDGETIAILQDDGVSVYAIRQRQIA